MNGWSMMLFLLLVLAVSGGIHAFLYRGLVRGLGIRRPGLRIALAALAALLAVSYPLARWMESFAPMGLVVAANTVAAWWIGFMLHLLWIGLLLWLGKQVLRIAGVWRRPAFPRAALGRWAVGGTVGAALVLGLVGARTARQPATVREVEVPVPGLAEGLSDLRIVVAADLHAGILMGAVEVEQRVAEILALEPDLVLLPGDLIDHPVARLEDGIGRALGRLRAPLGVYASTGNHEYYIGVEEAVAWLRGVGLRMLLNEREEVAPGLLVAGVEDRTARRFDRPLPSPSDLLGPRGAGRATILLDHTPATEAVRASMAAGADLVVSGHTHGGQIWPFSYLTRWAFPYHHGLYRVGRGHQLTTSGLGWWGPPMRLGTQPEIVLVRLVPAPSETSARSRP